MRHARDCALLGMDAGAQRCVPFMMTCVRAFASTSKRVHSAAWHAVLVAETCLPIISSDTGFHSSRQRVSWERCDEQACNRNPQRGCA